LELILPVNIEGNTELVGCTRLLEGVLLLTAGELTSNKEPVVLAGSGMGLVPVVPLALILSAVVMTTLSTTEEPPGANNAEDEPESLGLSLTLSAVVVI
jgi:hypothetical protein